jgi:DNA mismatch repair protein MutL
MIVDQHAAHERIVYEDLKARAASKTLFPGTPLLFPETFSLTGGDFAFFLTVRDLLEESGWAVEPFGEQALLIRAVPGFLQGLKPASVLQEILDELKEWGRSEVGAENKEHLRRRLACRASLMAGARLGAEDALELLTRLMTTPDGLTCPHGRPVAVVFQEADLERLFKRR